MKTVMLCINILLIGLTIPSYSQTVAALILSVKWKGDSALVITYDLTGEPKSDYEVELHLLKEGDPDYDLTLKGVSGDVGEGKFAGSGKIIEWYPKADLPHGASDAEFKFKLIVERVTPWTPPWYLYAGGSVIVGGLAILLTKKDEPPPPPVYGIPLPPAR